MAFRDRYSEALIPHFHSWPQRKVEIKAEPTPLIGPSTRIATIGSCFAEEIAGALDRLGLEGGMNPAGLVYNTRSLRQELLRAFGEWDGHEAEPFWKIDEGYISPFKHPKAVHPTAAALSAWSDDLDRRASELFRSADVIIMTVGLIETWMQPKTGNCYRYLPPAGVFEEVAPKFHRLTVSEMLEDLREIRASIRRNTSAEIIVTVSPVPLHATFTPLDIRVANTESKARIRAAVSEFVAEHPDIHYFHSYEIVSTAERLSDFMLEDGRHVSRRGVDYILSEFMRQFAGEGVRVPSPDSSWITPPTKTASAPRRTLARRVRAWASAKLPRPGP